LNHVPNCSRSHLHTQGAGAKWVKLLPLLETAKCENCCRPCAHLTTPLFYTFPLQVEWFPVQCPVGSSTFKYGYQGGNPWYRKMMVANTRVPVRNVQMWRDGAWRQLTKTIDNYW
jgi:hypothetical protein